MLTNVTRAALAAGALVLSANSAMAVVLYDSQGFEASAGYTTTYLTGQSTTAPAADRWAEAPTGAVAPYAAVYSYAAPSPGNSQYALVGATNVPATNSNLFYPQTYVASPYTPAAGQGIAITWTMATLSSGLANNPFFGIVAFNGNNVIAQAGIDASTGQIAGNGVVTPVSSFTAAADTYYNYELLLNFAAQTYSIYTAPAGSLSYTLRATGVFDSAATSFTDADLASFSLATGPTPGNYSGYAVFDYYKVETVPVPEPVSVGIAGLALGLLGSRRRVRSA